MRSPLGAIVLATMLSAGCADRETLTPAYPLSRTQEEDFRRRIPRNHRRPEWAPPSVDQFVLRNGIRVYAVSMPAAGLLSITYVNRRVTEFDTRVRTALASLMPSALTAGTRTHPGLAHARAVHALGARLESHVNGTALFLTLTTLPPTLRQSAQLLYEAVSEPTIDDEDFAQTIRVRRSLRHFRGQGWVGQELALGSLFGSRHPFAMPRGGSVPQLDALRAEELRALHRERVIPAHSALTVVGEFDRGALEAALNDTWGQWSVAGAREIGPDAPPSEATSGQRAWQFVDTESATENASVTVAWPMVTLLDDSFGDALVLDQILATSGSGVFDQSLRERANITYGVDVRTMINLVGGYGVANVVVATRDAPSAVSSLLAEITRLRTTRVSRSVIDAARGRLRNELLSSFESVAGTADRVSGLFAFGLEPSSWRRHLALIDGVTPETLQRTAQRLLAADRIAVAVVGDRTAIGAPLRSLAPYGLSVFTFVE
ncbi:MAG: pitrilysin family protein [Polyangiales bacterium]